MPMPKPDPQMTKMIKMMSGTWTVTEKSDPNPMMPKGGTGKGTATMTPGPGGMSLMEKYHSSGMMGGNFSCFGTFWWDPKANAYRGVWCDTMTPGGCDSSGAFVRRRPELEMRCKTAAPGPRRPALKTPG